VTRREGPDAGPPLVALVRHAAAVERAAWPDDDGARPLSERGRRQAEALAARLAPGLRRVLSSPARRCVETVEPLARRVGVRVETVGWLAEGTPAAEALRRLEEAAHALAGGRLAACSHGDVLPALLELVAPAGGPPRLGTAEVVELELAAGHLRATRRREPR